MPATDHFRWNQQKLHVVFAASSVLLLASVIVMMQKDQADEWRSYQRTNFELETAVRERDLAALQSPEYLEQLQQLQLQKAAADTAVREFEARQPELISTADKLLRDVERLEIELKFKNSIRDKVRSIYDLAVRDGVSGARLEQLLADYNAEQAKCSEGQAALDRAKAALDDKNREIRQETRQRDELTAAIEKLSGDVGRVSASLETIRPTSTVSRWKRQLMELPIIDGFNSHLKVIQDWMPGLKQTLGMTKIARFDRCRTCHLNIDRTAAGNLPAFPGGHDSGSSEEVVNWVTQNQYPQPFSTHPRHDLFCTAASPHPVSKFGCTICHDGQGSGTSFGNAEHTPNDPWLAHEWETDYGYHPNHFWEYPMQPERFAESTCIKCHHQVTELGVNPRFGASAPKVVRGYELVKQYGCFGCHEIHGYDAGNAIGPDVRLEPQTPQEAARVAADPGQTAGEMRKVGPSLRHIASKTSAAWIEYWTEIPSRYRPSTRMPQFFQLTNQEDTAAEKYQRLELAGIAQVLVKGSQPFETLQPADGYQPNAERGKQFFSEKGCLACHQHAAVPGTTSTFGPNISDIHLKVKRNDSNAAFSDWLYTWIREPERYHPRTKMPHLYLQAEAGADGVVVDPAADITAFLLSQGPAGEYPSAPTADGDLDELVALLLSKARFSAEASQSIVATGTFPQKAADVVGDEAVLATADGTAADAETWRQKKLEYVGRKTISKYGCYACHDMPGYELARPIGVALHDWGRKDTSKLGFEHIQEFLHHHGEPENSEHKSTAERVDTAMRKARAGGLAKRQFASQTEADAEISAAFFYDSILHHGRPGFIWQKLRAPRSYDYQKIETKGYDERLRMPKFPLKEDEIEAIATFILGLVAEPPAPEYVYTPDERGRIRLEGESLLAKYNCTGCHMVELPAVTFGAQMDEIYATELTPQDHPAALEILLRMRPPRQALTGKSHVFQIDDAATELPLAKVRAIRSSFPDPEADPVDRESGFDLWETADFGTDDAAKRLLPGSRLIVPEALLTDYEPARGGSFAEWLVEELMVSRTGGNRQLAWQASPPPLIQEGFKVQTGWLYQFLLEPARLRYTTVLRMPRFNMSSDEARILANYFAAADGVEFPYEEMAPSQPEYLMSQQAAAAHAGLLSEGELYLEEAWRSLNGPLCVKCHSVGTRRFKVSDPAKDIQGPNLNVAQQRLRADWLSLWLYNPKWILPYTSMPVNFPKNNNTQFPDLFNGDPGAQVIGTRDAILNYSQLLETVGPVVYAPPGAAAADAPAGASADSSGSAAGGAAPTGTADGDDRQDGGASEAERTTDVN